MTFIVDTNILFSACISPNGRIFEILFNAENRAEIVSPHFTLAELARHKSKLVRLSKQSAEKTELLLEAIIHKVNFIQEEIIDPSHWREAYDLVSGVDADDINFVALALQTGGMLWTGDKKLADHLIVMGFDRVISTAELYELLGLN